MHVSLPRNYANERQNDMNDKKVIENYKSVRAVEHAQPDPSVQIAARDDLIAMVDRAFETPNPDAQPETRSYKQIVSDIQNDQTKSDVRKELELWHVAIEDRRSHRKKVITFSDDAPQVEPVSEEPLFERIRFWRGV